MKFIPVITLVIFWQDLTYLEGTERPIIGILSQEFDNQSFASDYYPATNFIAASYVKAVEASGARAVPIFIKKKFTYYKNLLHSINGVVIPGGKAALKPNYGYYDAVVTIYKLAKEMNNKGIYFPILGVCRGFEALLIASNNDIDMQIRCDVIHENYPLIFSKNFRKSLTFARLPEEHYIPLKYFDVTKNNHEWCTTLTNFTKYSLDKKWLVTTTNINDRGLEFISSVEHKKYPFVALQFHPEKSFEWNPNQNNPHSRIAVRVNRYFYELLVDLARLNYNAFLRKNQEKKALIYNYNPRIMKNGSFDQIYVFI